MLVYRVCSKEEVDFLLNGGDISLVGGTSEKYEKNNHHYEENERYMHFFQKEGNVALVGQFPKDYICVYDIPDDVLLGGIGIGNYIYFPNRLELTEYAIRSRDMLFEYLKQVKFARDWLHVSLFMDHIPEYLTEIIYNNETPTFGGR